MSLRINNQEGNNPSYFAKKDSAPFQSVSNPRAETMDPEFFRKITKMQFMRVLPKLGEYIGRVCRILNIDRPNLCVSFEFDLSVDLLEAVAVYDAETDSLVLRTHCMYEDTLKMYQYAIARELTKKWVYMNDQSDWAHYPASDIREDLDKEQIADGIADALMWHFYPSGGWDRYGICDHNQDKYPDCFGEIASMAEEELDRILNWNHYYRK